MIETIIVTSIISAALFWGIKSAYSTFNVKNNSPCSGDCSGCSCGSINKSEIADCKK